MTAPTMIGRRVQSAHPAGDRTVHRVDHYEWMLTRVSLRSPVALCGAVVAVDPHYEPPPDDAPDCPGCVEAGAR